MTPDAKPTPAPRWAVVEIFGHQRIAGAVTEHYLAGRPFVRVTVPAIEWAEVLDDGGTSTCTIAEHVRDIKPEAIHSIHWCDEPTAHLAAHGIRHRLRLPLGAEPAARSLLDGLPTREA